MAVSEGNGAREFTEAVQLIANGDAVNQTNLRASAIDLEKRTNALKDHTNALESFTKELLGNDDESVGGIQGKFNNEHTHNGDDAYLIDLQQAYNNGDASAMVNVETNGAITLKLALGSKFTIRASDGTILLEVDNDTKTVTTV